MLDSSKNPRWAIRTTQTIAKRSTEALKEDSAQLGETNAAGALARGRLFAMAAYHDEAAESFKEALTLDPTTYEAAARLVLVLLRTEKRAEALTVAMKLAADAPKYSMRETTSDEAISVFTLLGNALGQNDRTADAIQAYETARKVNAEDSTAAARLAQLYLATGEPKKALAQAPAFANNPRFHDLSQVMSLGLTSDAFLPSFSRVSIPDMLAHTDHGRPLSIGGDARLAPLVHGDDAWCSEVSDLLGDGPAQGAEPG